MKTNIKNFWGKHSKKIIAGAVVVGTIITASALILIGCRHKAINDFGLEEVIAE